MNSTAFQVNSVTYAMRGRTLLEQHGIRAQIRRSTKTTADNGCGYSLIVSGQTEVAEKLLRANGVPIRRVARADTL